jgi:hypothetical protein
MMNDTPRILDHSDADPNWRGRHRQGCSVITLFLAEEPVIANRY